MQDTDLAWLAGIWEGEGSILLYSRPVNDKRIQITPSVTVSNTDIHIMNRVRSIIEEMGCTFSWRQYRPKNGTRDCYRYTSCHYKYIKIFLEHTLPFMVGEKKAYGETLLAFVTRRQQKADVQGKMLKHLPYDEEDYEFIRSSTTTREASTDEDIV